MQILQCMSWNFCVKFQRTPLKFHSKFWAHIPQNIHFTDSYFCVWFMISLNCDVMRPSPRCLDKFGNNNTVSSYKIESIPLPLLGRILKVILYYIQSSSIIWFVVILHMTLCLQWQKMNQILESQQTPHYLAIIGELWGVYCEDFGENWPCYNGTALYILLHHNSHGNWVIFEGHYGDVIMGMITSQITSLTIVYSTFIQTQIKENIKAPRLTGLCVGNSPGPVNSPHKWPVTRKMFPFDDVIM